jgi:hypothetical protein
MLSSRPTPRVPAQRETEGEWRDPDTVSTRCGFKEFYPGTVPQKRPQISGIETDKRSESKHAEYWRMPRIGMAEDTVSGSLH